MLNLKLMEMIKSKLNSRFQIEILQQVRSALGLEPGDSIRYESNDGQVVLTHAGKSPSLHDPFRRFNEWSTQADQSAYSRL